MSCTCRGSTAASTTGFDATCGPLDEQQRHGAFANQLPIGIRQQRALQERVMMRIFRHEPRALRGGALDDHLRQRIVPCDIDGDAQPALAQRSRKLLELAAMPQQQAARAHRHPGSRPSRRARHRCSRRSRTRIAVARHPFFWRAMRRARSTGCSSLVVGSTTTRICLADIRSPETGTAAEWPTGLRTDISGCTYASAAETQRGSRRYGNTYSYGAPPAAAHCRFYV